MKPAEDARVQEILNHGYQLTIGDYISKGWEIVKKDMWQYVGFSVVAGLISLIAGAIFRGLQNIFLSPHLYVGYALFAEKRINGAEPEFNDFFSGFKKNYLQILSLQLVSMIILLFAFLLLIIPGIYLSIAYSMAIYLVVFRDYEFWDAMEISRKVVTKRWFDFFLLFLVIGLINIVGALCLVVGLLVTIPLSQIIMFLAYQHIFGEAQVTQGAEFVEEGMYDGVQDTDIDGQNAL